MSGEKLISTRRSRDYFAGVVDDMRLRRLTRVGLDTEGMYAFMLREDVRELLPDRGGDNNGLAALVESSDPDRATELITRAMPSEHRPHDWLSPALHDFFSVTAQGLVSYGFVYYEIAFLSPQDAAAGSTPVGFRIERIPPGTVHYRRGRPVQYVPVNGAPRRTRRGVGYIDLDPNALVRFELPADLRRQVRRAQRLVRLADVASLNASALPNQGAPEQGSFRSTEHHRMAIETAVRATASLGWSASRGALFTDGLLEPYRVWRTLEFLAFKIKLRDEILSRLNTLLTTAGQRLSLDMSIGLAGATTFEQVRAAQQELIQGERTLADLELWAIQ